MPSGASRPEGCAVTHVWSPPGSGAQDRRLRVYRETRPSVRANAAIGSPVTPEVWLDACGHETEAMPDPEEAADHNVLDTE